MLVARLTAFAAVLAGCAAPTVPAYSLGPGSAPTASAPQELDHADRVGLANGDRLTGTVNGLVGGVLVIRTEYAEEIVMEWANVTTLETVTEIAVALDDEKTYSGTVTLYEDGRIIIGSIDEEEPIETVRERVVGFNLRDTAPVEGPQLELTTSQTADLLILENEDRVSGILKEKDGTRLVMDTGHSDFLRVRFSRVIEVETAAPFRVEFIDDTVATGILSIDRDGMATVTPVDGGEPVQRHRSRITHIERRVRQIDGDLYVSMSAASQNTQNSTALIKWDLAWKGDMNTVSFRGNGNFNSTNRVTTDEQLYSQLRNDYLVGARTSLFGSAELDHDRFRLFDVRTTWTFGSGFEIVQLNWIELFLDAGLSYTFEDRTGESGRQRYPGVRLGLRFRWDLPYDFEVRDAFTYYADLEELGSSRFRNEISINRPVFKGWRLEAGLITTIEQEPLATVESVGNTYYLGLGYRF